MTEKTFAFPFEARLKKLDSAGNWSEAERNAATNTYERLITAKEIVSDAFGENGTDSALLISVFEALCAEARSLSANEA